MGERRKSLPEHFDWKLVINPESVPEFSTADDLRVDIGKKKLESAQHEHQLGALQLQNERQRLENEALKLKNDELKLMNDARRNDNEQRKKATLPVFLLVAVSAALLFGLVVWAAWPNEECRLKVPENVQIAALTAIGAEMLGLLGFVLKYLYSSTDATASAE